MPEVVICRWCHTQLRPEKAYASDICPECGCGIGIPEVVWVRDEDFHPWLTRDDIHGPYE